LVYYLIKQFSEIMYEISKRDQGEKEKGKEKKKKNGRT